MASIESYIISFAFCRVRRERTVCAKSITEIQLTEVYCFGKFMVHRRVMKKNGAMRQGIIVQK